MEDDSDYSLEDVSDELVSLANQENTLFTLDAPRKKLLTQGVDNAPHPKKRKMDPLQEDLQLNICSPNRIFRNEIRESPDAIDTLVRNETLAQDQESPLIVKTMSSNKKTISSGVEPNLEEERLEVLNRDGIDNIKKIDALPPEISVVDRIPGPAGKLPSLTKEEREKLFREESEAENTDFDKKIETTGSQVLLKLKSHIVNRIYTSDVDYPLTCKLSWRNMLAMYPEYNENIKGRCISAFMQKPKYVKIPSLMVIIENYRKTEVGAGVVLRDPSGKINGCINKCVMNTFGSDIGKDAVLHLQNVSVFKPTIEMTYLNIMLNNILCIFPAKGVPVCIHNTKVFAPPNKNQDSPVDISRYSSKSPNREKETSSFQINDPKSKINAEYDIPTDAELEKILECDELLNDII